MNGLIGIGVLHPGLLVAGAAAVGVPILVHLWNRHQPRRVRWAAMQFLERAYRRSVRRVRMEEAALLALRMAAVALVALAVSRPYLGSAFDFLRGGGHHILLIDDSFSMRALSTDGGPLFDRALEISHEWVDSLSIGDRATVIATSLPARVVFDSRLDDGERLLESIQVLRAGLAGDDLPGALRLVDESVARGAGHAAVGERFSSTHQWHDVAQEAGGAACGLCWRDRRR